MRFFIIFICLFLSSCYNNNICLLVSEFPKINNVKNLVKREPFVARFLLKVKKINYRICKKGF